MLTFSCTCKQLFLELLKLVYKILNNGSFWVLFFWGMRFWGTVFERMGDGEMGNVIESLYTQKKNLASFQ